MIAGRRTTRQLVAALAVASASLPASAGAAESQVGDAAVAGRQVLPARASLQRADAVRLVRSALRRDGYDPRSIACRAKASRQFACSVTATGWAGGATVAGRARSTTVTYELRSR